MPKKFLNEILNHIKFCLFFIFGHWAKRNRLSGKIVSEKRTKLLSMCPKDSSEEKTYNEESVFYSFLMPESFCHFFHGRFFKSALYVSKRKFWEKKFFWRKLICFIVIFGHWAKNHWFFVGMSSAGLSKLQFTCL